VTISTEAQRQPKDDAETGQALVEYALILMLVAMVSVAILGAIGQSVLGPLTSVGNAI
jgi:Flp pilus assembly pilin Flp